MGLLDKILGDNEDPKLNALIDTNHKLTLIHVGMCENYTQQVADLKQRIEMIEHILKVKFENDK